MESRAKGLALATTAAVAVTAAVVGVTTTQTGRDAVAVTESPLSNELAARPEQPMPIHPPSLFQFNRFVLDAQSAAYYPKWVAANCGASRGGTPLTPLPETDAFRWYGYRDAIKKGTRIDAPVMVTAYGRSLVDAGLIVLQAAP